MITVHTLQVGQILPCDGSMEVNIATGILANPFTIGGASLNGEMITDVQGIMRCYFLYAQYKIQSKMRHFTYELDKIAWNHLDGRHVKLVFFGSEEMNHGHVIKDLIHGTIDGITLLNQSKVYRE